MSEISKSLSDRINTFIEKEIKYTSGKTGKPVQSYIRHGGKLFPREEAIKRANVGRLKEGKIPSGPKLPKGKRFEDLSREEQNKRLFG